MRRFSFQSFCFVNGPTIIIYFYMILLYNCNLMKMLKEEFINGLSNIIGSSLS